MKLMILVTFLFSPYLFALEVKPPKTDILCSARGMGEVSGKNVSIKIILEGKPNVEVKFPSDPESNFKIGRGFANGENILMDKDTTCVDELKKETDIFAFSHSCKYNLTDIEIAKSSIFFLPGGFGQLCRNQSTVPGLSWCWQLSQCKIK